MKNLFNLPTRPVKPRETGLTMSLDSGLSIEQVKHNLEINAEYIDYVKLGWGTSIVTPKLREKIEAYNNYGIPVCLGGTFFELAILQHKTEEIIPVLKDLGINLIEISDGSIILDKKDKLAYISRFAKEFKVLSEVGSKDSAAVVAPSKWRKEMQSELDAGSWKVIAEGRESGTAGLYRESNEVRMGLIDEITSEIPHENIIWEAPLKAQQVWFIQQFGTNVNLGNIAPANVLSLETLRLGLRSDTLLQFHGDETH